MIMKYLRCVAKVEYVLGFDSGLSFITTNNEKWKQYRENASTTNSKPGEMRKITM